MCSGVRIEPRPYKDYILVINKYQIPYFRRTGLDNIRHAYSGYIEYVAAQLGRKPAASTVSTHHAALNVILDRAKEHGWVSQIQIPKLKNDGKLSERRASFDIAEYRTLIRKLRHWVKKPTHRNKDAEIKELLYDYVLLLAYSGIRHVREAMNLKWRNVSFAKSGSDKDLVVLDVLKKKGRKGKHIWRKVVVRHNRLSDAKKVLTRLKKRVPELRNYSLESLINAQKDIPLFCLSDLTQPKRMDGRFKKFLLDSGLGVGSEDKMRSLYSLRHFYVTQQLTGRNPISIALLAKQMGTSVKMIEQYYGHLDTVKAGDELSGD